MKKKFTAIFLMSIAFVMLIFATTASATTITDLKNKFPAGKYWNHPSGGNNPDGYSNTPCKHHNNCDYYGNCGCNSFSSASQCHGFGLKLGYDYYGKDPRNWPQKYNLNSLKAGDIVRFNNGSYPHTIWVTNVSGSSVTYADCNSDNKCKIRWDQTTTKSFLSSRLIYVLSAPSEAIDDDNNRSKWRVTATDGINIRKEASTGSSKVGAIPYNSYFYITERKQANEYTWGKVDNYSGISGWCVLNYATHISGPIPAIKNDSLAPIHQDTNPHVRNGFFTFKNASSGTFMNVWGGADGNKTEITTYSFDGSIDQRFNVIHKGNGKYKLYAECSSDGTNRVVDIFRNNAALAEGQKVDLYDPNDDTAQLFYIWPIGNNEYVFETASKDGYCIAPPSGLAGSNSRSSQLTLQKYTGGAHQKWKLCNNNGKETTPNISYAAGSYKVDTEGDPLNMRSGAGTSHNRVGSIPDKTTLRVTQVSGNWGYTSYNGTNGWVCLDFMVYTVTLDSISISIPPDKTSYCVGEKFEPLGMQIKAQYSDGQEEIISSGFTTTADTTSPGSKNVTVQYKGKTAIFTIDVNELAVTDISIQENNLKKEYNIGDSIDIDGLQLLVEYSNGNTYVVDSGFTTDYDFSTPGTKTVTVSYGGKSTSYDVEVLENTSSNNPKIEISSEKCYSGSSAIVDVKLKSKDVYDGNMTIEYDADNLKLVSAEACGALSDRQVTINLEYSENQIRISFSGTTPVVSNDTILKIKFTAFNNAEGAANIKVFETKMYDKTGNPITTYASDGKIDIINVVYEASVTNIQSVSSNGRKIVTADVSSDKVVCYLVSYGDGQLIECDRQYPSNGSVELSIEDIPNAQFKFMVWNEAMKPMIEARNIY